MSGSRCGKMRLASTVPLPTGPRTPHPDSLGRPAPHTSPGTAPHEVGTRGTWGHVRQHAARKVERKVEADERR